MKSYKTYGDGQYLKKEDVSPPQAWTITDVKEQTVTTPGKEPKDKPGLVREPELIRQLIC